MGTDCRVIAKLKDGTIKHRYLDRFYVFSDYMGIDHERLVDRNFTIEQGLQWCAERKKVIQGLSSEEKEDNCINAEYHLAMIDELFKFLNIIKSEEIASVKILADSDREYDEIFFYDRSLVLVEV